MLGRRRFRRIIRRAKIEAIVDAQRQAKDCNDCRKRDYSRADYMADTPLGDWVWIYADDSSVLYNPIPTFH